MDGGPLVLGGGVGAGPVITGEPFVDLGHRNPEGGIILAGGKFPEAPAPPLDPGPGG